MPQDIPDLIPHPDGHFVSSDHVWVLHRGGGGWVLGLGGQATSEDFRLAFSEAPDLLLATYPDPVGAARGLGVALARRAGGGEAVGQGARPIIRA
jgi:hypothetical protein